MRVNLICIRISRRLLPWQAVYQGLGIGMGWFRKHQWAAVQRRRFADLQAQPPEERRALFAGPDGAAWIEAAALYGLVEAQVLLGQMYLDRGNAALALQWFEAAAGAGYAPAVNMVGRCCEKGWGMEPDLAEAARRYQQAAEAGLDWAQYNLANLLLYGLGVLCDRSQAFDWYGRAARQGHAKSMNMLARFHEEGWDRPKDSAQAAAWYRRAAEAGDFRAQYNLATLLAQRGRRSEALAWLERAFAHGSPDFLAQAGAVLRASGDLTLQAIGRRAAARSSLVGR